MLATNQMNRTPNLEEEFSEQYDQLVSLIGGDEMRGKAARLNEIYGACEAAWNRNLYRLRNTDVKYLLIAEAAPWSGGDLTQYFYETFDKDDNGKPIQWIRSLWKVFYPCPPPNDIEQSLRMLAQSQFLLVDSLPFALSYKSYRKNPEYRELVLSCSEYLRMKLQCDRINWSNDCKVALAFKLNGLAVIESFPEGITFPNGRNIVLGEANIAATGSGFLTNTSLKQVWEIDQNFG